MPIEKKNISVAQSVARKLHKIFISFNTSEPQQIFEKKGEKEEEITFITYVSFI